MTTRWQLARAGILNVYQYEDEILEFHGGRLLLRGINGSGKSTAMNMLLPFLLTGRTRGIDAAGEQSGVLKSWMLTGRDEPQPVGYLWIEFARDAAGGDGPQHLVIGCGIKANRASDTLSTWWFVTRRRPGIDLQLLEHGVPLSAEGLRVALDADPVFTHDRRADYRREVAQRLYGGADNEPWLALLDTVRNPRVGDRIDRDLPEYLTRALPTLSETALVEAARPLDDLDEHRRNVADLATTDETLRAIGEVYRRYALVEIHRELDAAREVVKRANARWREERAAIETLKTAVRAADEARERWSALNASVLQLDEEIRALRDSSAYTEGRQLDDLRTEVAELARRLQHQRSALVAAEDERERDARELRSRQRQCEADRQQLAESLNAIASAVQEQSLTVGVPVPPAIASQFVATEGEPLAGPTHMLDATPLDVALTDVSVAATARRADVEAIQRLNAALMTLEAEVAVARNKVDLAEQAEQEAEVAHVEAREACEHARADWDAAMDVWFETVQAAMAESALPEFLTDQGRLLIDSEVRIDRAARRADVETFLAVWHDDRQRVALQSEADERDAREREADAQRVLDELLAQCEPLLPRPAWQSEEGVAFADVIDFQANVDDAGRANLEAALQASGLLSATIGADGVRLATGELVVSAGDTVVSPLSELLAPVAVADLPAGVEQDAVTRLLAAISTDLSGLADTVIAPDGHFRLGRLHGRYEKTVAEHVGVGARRAALERQRDEARRALAAATEDSARTVDLRQRAESTLDACNTCRRSLPSLSPVASAEAAVITAETRQQRAAEYTLQSRTVFGEIDQRLSGATDERDRQARSHRLSTDAIALHAAATSLDDLGRDTRAAGLVLATLQRSVADWSTAAERWRATAARVDGLIAQLAQDTAHHDARRSRLDTLEATLGTAYREVVARIDSQQHALNDTKEQLPQADAEREQRLTDRAGAEAARNQAIEACAAAEHACRDCHAHLGEVAEVPGLIDIVREIDPGAAEDTTSDEAVAIRFQERLREHANDRAGLAKLLSSLTDLLPPRPDAQQDITADGVRGSIRQRRDRLGAGWDAESHQPDSTLALSLSVNGPLGRFSLADALVEVGTQLRQLQALLSQKQDQALRELLHGQLAGDVARKLQQAKTLIERMNERLASVTTSHGIGVRLRWRRDPELDEATSRMVDILEKLPDLRNEAEERELRETLAARLDEARRLEPESPYRELIDRVLDYRGWHTMHVLLRRGNDAERPLSRRTPLSEGEKKLVTYLPLFSALAAGCDALEERASAAGPPVGVPRFLLLDDAFAKVSEDNHARLFGLLVELDLDFIATSERLWGTHATVPALAITEVVRDEAAGVILLEHSQWDGHTLTMPA